MHIAVHVLYANKIFAKQSHCLLAGSSDSLESPYHLYVALCSGIFQWLKLLELELARPSFRLGSAAGIDIMALEMDWRYPAVSICTAYDMAMKLQGIYST